MTDVYTRFISQFKRAVDAKLFAREKSAFVKYEEVKNFSTKFDGMQKLSKDFVDDFRCCIKETTESCVWMT